MSNKKTIQELRRELNEYYKYKHQIIIHTKSGGKYAIMNIHFKEDDLSIWFSYEPFLEMGVSFLRPITELLDGRFTFENSNTSNG